MRTNLLNRLATLVVLAVAVAGCFTPTTKQLVFSPDTLPDATAGVAYEARIEISNNVTPAYDFAVSAGGLPPGVELRFAGAESDTGVVSGTPTAAGDYTFTVRVQCYGTQVSGQTGTKEYTIRVR